MSLVDVLDRAIEVARKVSESEEWRRLGLGALPISFSAFASHLKGPLWEEEDLDSALAEPQETLDTMRGYIAAEPNNLAVRWAILAFLYDLSQEPTTADELNRYADYARWGIDLPDPKSRLTFREELGRLLRLPDISQISDPQRLHWEIQSCCFVSEFQQAETLFHRLREVDASRLNDALFGQFHLLIGLDASPNEVGWLSHRFVSPGMPEVKSARWALAVDGPVRIKDAWRLKQVRHWFEEALHAGYKLPPHAEVALARCLFEERNYLRAAEVYQGVLHRGGLVFTGEHAQFNDELNSSLYLALARSHERAKEWNKAKVVLEGCVEKFPAHGPAFRRLAELTIVMDPNCPDYRGAYEVLMRWAEREPALDQDIWVATLRALGETEANGTVEALLNQAFDAQPQRLHWVEQAISCHWPGFARLSEKGKLQWLYGSWTLWWRPPGIQKVDNAAAAKFFCLTLELELRERVFDQFVSSMDQATIAHCKAEIQDRNDRRLHARGKGAWKRLLEGKGTLGDMLMAVCTESNLMAGREFEQWLQRTFGGFSRSFDKDEAEQLNSARTDATHQGELPRDRVENVSALCRKYLDCLVDATANPAP